MAVYGYALSSEEHGPLELVRQARMAEDAGFSFLSISDHFHPWTSEQGNSPFVWSVIGGIASTTDRIHVGTGVTCPIQRMHPAIVAQAAATAAEMLPGRFHLGVGSGEALNEHVVGGHWPVPSERLEMLEEAIDVIRQLWEGDRVNFAGKHFRVDSARLFTRPQTPPELYVAAASPAAARMAARNDGLIATGPDPDLFREFAENGGGGKPRFGQITVCWAPNMPAAVETARRVWPISALSWEVRGNVPTPEIFDEVTKRVDESELTAKIICGPDAAPIIDEARKFEEAGFDHIYFHQVGKNQQEFMEFYRGEIAPKLGGKVAPTRNGSHGSN